MKLFKLTARLIWQLDQEVQSEPVNAALSELRPALREAQEVAAKHEEVARLATALLDDALPRGVALDPDILDRLTVALSTP